MDAGLTKTWIDRKLTRKERKALVDYLMERAENPSGEEIAAAIGVLFPGKTAPSLPSCIAWKNAVWRFERLERRRAADDVRAKIIVEESYDKSDASKKLLDGYVFRELEKLADGESKEIDPHLRGWIQAASQLASRSVNDKKLASDLEKSRAQVAILAAQIADFKRRDEEREAAKQNLTKTISKRGMSEDVRREIEEGLKLL